LKVIKWKPAFNFLRYIWFFIMATYKNLNNKMYRNKSDLDFVMVYPIHVCYERKQSVACRNKEANTADCRNAVRGHY